MSALTFTAPSSIPWIRLSVATLLSALLLTQSHAAELPAFPGAGGFGSTTPGGRGGKVLLVTNLDDSGPGSFRAACESEGPRIVVFRVGGVIRLKRDITVRSPFLTIAGQSAPGDGICLRDATFGIATHDVIVRYLRSRFGDESGKESDAFDLLHGASNVIVDHCSASWAVDECLSLSGNDANCTVQWCLIGESLNHSIHSKGNHGYGSLTRANGPISFHHNLWIHNDSRNPRMGDNYGRPPYPTFDVRNNVIYDYGGTASGLTQGRLKINYVANYIRPGPSSRARTPISVGGPSELAVFIRDNIWEGNESFTADNTRFLSPVEIEGKRQFEFVNEPHAAPPVKTLPAKEAYELVLASVGASWPVRDSVDTRLVQEVRDRKGELRNSQKDVGGWPEYRSGEPPKDSDNDGIPDTWESAHGLNPNDPSDATLDRDSDGYSNIEEYLNSLASVPAPRTASLELKPDVTVAADGSGDFKTIQAAVASIAHDNRERQIVFIKDGTYHEKVRVDASFVTLRGQSRTGTRIEFPQLNDDFTARPDQLGRAVINVNGDDFVLENLTAENTAGVVGPHAFTIYGRGDRTVIENCDVLSDGADTVSLWLSDRGRYYHSGCNFRGSVDFVCPRGWCYVTNCTFYEMKDTAAVWHDGAKNRDMKFVLRNCRFDGTNGWNLARHHHDEQFYFLDCTFSKTMIDRAPFRVIYPLNGSAPSAADIQRNKDLDHSNVWGERNYFFNCHREGGDYSWQADNLATAPGSPKPGDITAAWTFGGTWNPERSDGPFIQSVSTNDGKMRVKFSESVTVKGKPRLLLKQGGIAEYASGSGSDTLIFSASEARPDPAPQLDLNGGAILANEAAATLRLAAMTLP